MEIVIPLLSLARVALFINREHFGEAAKLHAAALGTCGTIGIRSAWRRME